MINSLSKASYDITDKGNEYKKSNTGKKAGTALGAAAGAGLLWPSSALADISHDVCALKQQGKTKEEIKTALFFNDRVKFLKNLVSPKRVLRQFTRTENIFNTYTKSKIVNRALMIGSLAQVPLAVAGIGFLVGSACDKIADNFAMKKADKAAETQK